MVLWVSDAMHNDRLSMYLVFIKLYSKIRLLLMFICTVAQRYNISAPIHLLCYDEDLLCYAEDLLCYVRPPLLR